MRRLSPIIAAVVVVTCANLAHSQPAPVSFRLDVMPILSKAGCNAGACHGNAQGKGGFRLSLRGEDSDFDWMSLTHDTHARRVNPTRPEASLMLLKPTGQVAHEGGQRFAIGSEAYQTVLDWIAGGAVDDRETAPKVLKLNVTPGEQLLEPAVDRAERVVGYSLRLNAIAELSDGTRRDVTRQATYELNDPTRAAVGDDGIVTATRPGEIAVSVRYLRGRATARLAFLAHRPDFAWNGPPPVNFVDEHVFAKLKRLRINPAPVCVDEVFVRRVYLDMLGVLPTAEEVRRFLEETDPGKRTRLVDALLTRPEFDDFWALKWADLLRNEEKTMGTKGVWIFQRWLRDQVAADVPMNEFVHALITSQGSTWRTPPASFYRTNRDPQTCAETVGQVFLGVRLQCARCHNHPFDVWTQDDYYGLAAAFANLDRKQIDNKRRDQFDKHEINGDEVIFASGSPRLRQPRSGMMMAPRPLGGESLRAPDASALGALADSITSDRQFARVMANRVWFHLMGRGIVEPVDDFRASNPPSNPALLEALADAFIADGMRLRPLVRTIVLSRTYGLDATTNETNGDDEINFSHAQVKLLPAEVLLDALGQALEARGEVRSAAPGTRVTQMAGVRTQGAFLKTFGKPDRLLTCECERSDATTLAQALQLVNGEEMRSRIEAPGNRIGRLLAAGTEAESMLDDLYLSALSRPPSATERAGMMDHVAKATDKRRAWEDVAWALVNSKEFLLRH